MQTGLIKDRSRIVKRFHDIAIDLEVIREEATGKHILLPRVTL